MINKRKKYLQNKISHEEFYLSFADAISFNDLATLVLEAACKSRNPHFSDVPLKLWDYRFAAVRMLVSRAIEQGHVIKKSNVLSAKEAVCILKAVARECAASQLV